MQNLLKNIVKALEDNPEQIKITPAEGNQTIILGEASAKLKKRIPLEIIE